MIKAVVGSADRSTATGVILGLSAENWARLLANKPIVVKLSELDPRLPELDVCLIGGDTEASIAEDLRALAPIGPSPDNTEREKRR